MRRFLVPLLVIAALPLSSASAQYRTQRGSVLGGLAGAAAGVAIGEHNDKPVAGALIGGAVGMVAGAALGNSQDRRAAEQRAYQYQQQQQQQQRRHATQASPGSYAQKPSGRFEVSHRRLPLPDNTKGTEPSLPHPGPV